jgi:expansin (peptidoglycan-binding protein)
MSDLFSALDEDIDKPQVIKESLAQWDNYQIYTLVCVDRSYSTTKREYYQTGYNGLLAVLDPVTHKANLVEYNPIKNTNSKSDSKLGSWLAIQTFSLNKVKVNFLDYVNTYHE